MYPLPMKIIHIIKIAFWYLPLLVLMIYGHSLVDVANLDSIEPSPISMMPQGLINTMSKDDILDLLAYYISGGDPERSSFNE